MISVEASKRIPFSPKLLISQLMNFILLLFLPVIAEPRPPLNIRFSKTIFLLFSILNIELGAFPLTSNVGVDIVIVSTESFGASSGG